MSMVDKNGLWEQPLTPIQCDWCGWVGKGRYANRSTVCRYCRRLLHQYLSLCEYVNEFEIKTNDKEKAKIVDRIIERRDKYR